jgi:hypothetical protein
MADMRGEGFHEAWGAAIFGEGRKWPEMTLDGRRWTIEEALSDERLEAALRKTKQKAVGADGVDIVWLRAARQGGRHAASPDRFSPNLSRRPPSLRDREELSQGIQADLVCAPHQAWGGPASHPGEALYSTPLKLVLSTLLRGVADVAQSQLLPEQTGWSEVCGAVDASCLFAALHGQALARPGFCVILFLDLKQFFPRIPTRAIEIETILHGLPPDLQRLAA